MADIIPDGVIDFCFETQIRQNVGEPLLCRFAGKPNFAGADHRASVAITVDATARAATRKAKVVVKRSQVASIRPLSTAAIDQIVGAKATARLVPPRQAAERGGYRLVVTGKIVLGRWRRSVENGKRQVSKRGFRRNSKSF
jgi:hypothetical protein